MADKPNTDRIYGAIVSILERKYKVKINYSVDEGPPRGLFFSPSCCVNETNNETKNEGVKT